MRSTAFTLLLFLLFCASPAFSQDDKKPSAGDMEIMKKWMEASSPNDHHKALDALVGKWDMATSTWMEGPDAPPMKTTGTSEHSWMLDGRFLRQDTKGTFMGHPYTGFGLSGYDNMKKCYTMIWYYSNNFLF